MPAAVEKESFLTYLMPASLAIFYILKAGGPDDEVYSTVMYMALFQWLWALKNIALGPLRRDSGIISCNALLLSLTPTLTNSLLHDPCVGYFHMTVVKKHSRVSCSL